MQMQRIATKSLAGAAIALACSITTLAANNQSFIATTGVDSNACTATAYCRTLTKALTVTNPGGEIIVVNSGGYAPATIAQPVTITAIGVDASIYATTGNGLTINTTGNVSITGINLRGRGTGNDGILVEAVGFLRIYSVQIQHFDVDGIDFKAVDGNLAMYNSQILDNGHDGLHLDAAGARAYVNGTGFDNNTYAGGDSELGKLTIADSSAHTNGVGFLSNGGTVTLDNDRAIFNNVGLEVTAAGRLHFAGCLLSENTTAWKAAAGGTLSGSSPGTTLIAPGQASSGTLAAGTTLQ